MRVLVVEDDPDVSRIVSAMLQRRGHTVECLPSAFGATNKVAGRAGPRPDVVVMDLNMPGLSGDKLLEMWAQEESTRATPVVIFSATTIDHLRQVAQVHPRCSAVAKDGSFKALIESVENSAS